MSKTTRTSSRRVKRCILFFIFATTVLYLYIAVYTTYRSLTNNASTTTYPTLTTNSNQTHTLTYCIPSHPRLVDSKTHYLACDGKECHQADTLSATLSSLIENLIPLISLNIPIQIIVVDTSPDSLEHLHYKTNQALYQHLNWIQFQPMHHYFYSTNPTLNPATTKSTTDSNLPSLQVQRQSLHLANTIKSCTQHSKNIIIWEDDVLLCPRAANHILEALSIASSSACRNAETEPYTLIKFGIGMNGILMQSHIAIDYMYWLIDHITLKPCDLLIYDDFQGYQHARTNLIAQKQYEMKNTNHASKQSKNILDLHLVYRYHLGYHIGKISSFQIRNQMKYRNKHGLERVSHRCFEQSTSWIEKSSILYKQLGGRKMIDGDRWFDVAPCSVAGNIHQHEILHKRMKSNGRLEKDLNLKTKKSAQITA